ncbi:hypothetical protein TESG_06876 [Trichophyton tonsurans CBS 112818]|uniref:Uncharacterized protein n=1 Tax=Trichophyton tonsurans (strain CBS 112818) TaxID=647933 RepID=F2S792_TRIT1|nr:hypothetical protein TESG_06876 [Trichophyton tonsurans CBS 112818]
MKTSREEDREGRRRTKEQGKEDGRDEEVSISRPEYFVLLRALASKRVGPKTIDSHQRCLPGMMNSVADLSLPAYLDNQHWHHKLLARRVGNADNNNIIIMAGWKDGLVARLEGKLGKLSQLTYYCGSALALSVRHPSQACSRERACPNASRPKRERPAGIWEELAAKRLLLPASSAAYLLLLLLLLAAASASLSLTFAITFDSLA